MDNLNHGNDFDESNKHDIHVDEVSVRPLKIPNDCKDGLLVAFWQRPEAYLNSNVRQATSPFSKIENLAEGLQKVENDIASGAWAKNNSDILNSVFLDVGYRLIAARIRN